MQSILKKASCKYSQNRLLLLFLITVCFVSIFELIKWTNKTNFKVGKPKTYKKQTITNNLISENIKELKIEKNKCDIINKDYKQYTVDFDGVKYPRYLFLNQNKSINFDCLNKSSPMKTILAWNKWYGMSNYGYGIGKVEPFRNNFCPITNCELTNDKSRLKESDFVIVLMSDQFETLPSVSSRPKNQRWIWNLIESQAHTASFNNFNDYFNLTADFLLKSDFSNNYESQKRFLWNENKTFDVNHDFHSDKTDFMAALISNCHMTQNDRLTYINELKNYVQVDVIGKCGTPCPKDGDCREFIGNKYKFYFAFENSICKDYITEKFFIMLRYHAIPVVIGGGNYSHFVPKSAYINALDYESPKKLAEYLNYLDKNKTAFNSYFKWKKHVNFYDNTVQYAFLCDMCIKLHLETFFGIENKVTENFETYWAKSDCKNAQLIKSTGEKDFTYKLL